MAGQIEQQPSSTDSEGNCTNCTKCPPNDPKSNKAFVLKAYQEILGDHNFTNLEQYFHEDYIQHNPHAAEGREGLRAFVKSVPEGPQKIDFKRTVAEDDFVWVHVRMTSFNTSWAIVDIFRIECGKIKEHWDVLQDTKLQKKAANEHQFF